MFKGSLDLLRDADTIFKCRLPDLGNHLSLKSHSPSRLTFYLLFNIRERWRPRELKYLSRTCDLNMIVITERGSHEIARRMRIISAFGARKQSKRKHFFISFITLEILYPKGNERDEKAEKRANCTRKGRILSPNISLLIVLKLDFDLGSN